MEEVVGVSLGSMELDGMELDGKELVLDLISLYLYMEDDELLSFNPLI